MLIWIARSPADQRPQRDRFRIEIDGHPGILLYHGWEMREGELDEALYQQLCESTDEVEIEMIHQEIWRSLTPYEG